MDGIKIQCAHCGNHFYVCEVCWRGQKYCCVECRCQARVIKMRKYRKKYSQSEKGKAKNRERQRLFRKKLKRVTEQSSKLRRFPIFFPTTQVKSKKKLCSCCHKKMATPIQIDSELVFFSFHRKKAENNGPMVSRQKEEGKE